MTFRTYGELHPAEIRFRKCRCNMCGARFTEDEILVEDETDREYCPRCFDRGYIQGLEEGEE